MPTSASTRRTPEPIEASPSSFTRPSWPDRATWCRRTAHGSTLPPPRREPRSPYFSPNSASAPMARASSTEVWNARTARSLTSTRLTSSSTSRSTVTGTAPAAVKSNRAGPARSPSLPEPRTRPARRAARDAQGGSRYGAGGGPAALSVDLRVGGRADGDLAEPHGAPVHDEAGQRRLDVAHRDLRRPGGAFGADHAVVRELAAALGVERGPVQDDRDLLARRRGLDRDAAGQQPDMVASPTAWS